MMKKILVLNYEYPPIGGGGGVASQKIVNAYTKKGYKVFVITSNHVFKREFEVKENTIIIKVPVLGRNDLNKASYLSMLSYIFFACIESLRLTVSNSFEFIHTFFVIPTGLVGYIASSFSKKPQILTLIGGDIYDPSIMRSPHHHSLLRWTIKRIVKHSQVITAISEDTKANTQKYYSITKEIKVIPVSYDSVNLKAISREQLGLQNLITYLISIGRFVKRKGFDVLIQQFSQLDQKKFGLILIGDGPERKNLKHLAKHLNVSKQIKFAGNVSEEKKFKLLQTANIYYLSSQHEGFGIVLFEAMNAKLPIIATNKGGQTDFLENRINALLINYNNTSEFKQAVQDLISNPSLEKKFNQQNYQLLAKYSSKIIANKYIESIQSFI